MFGLFSGSDEEEGCNNHHFGEWKERNNWKLEEEYINVFKDVHGEYILSSGSVGDAYGYVGSFEVNVLKREKKRYCQHEGCYEDKNKWSKEYVFTPEDGNLMDYRKFLGKKMKEYEDDEE